MARDLESGKLEEERESDSFQGLRNPYLAVLRGEWDTMKDHFKNNPKDLFVPLSIYKDTAFHIAAYSEGKELLQCLVDLVEPPSILFDALQMKNIHGNNTFHEVAITERVETAEFLVKKLQRVYRLDDGKLEELLKDKNNLGETPIYRAVALGQTKMAKYLATKVGDLSYHFGRKDQMSILHIAVIGQHFDTALWVLRKEKDLAKEGEINELENKEEASGLTCLHLLAKMPHVFRSYPESSRMGELKKFLYYCLPSEFEDDACDDGDEAQIPSTTFKKEIFSKYRATWKSLAKGWPAIDKLWKMKRMHKSVPKLTDLLAKADLTWTKSFKVGNERKVSLGKEKERGLQGQQGEEKPSGPTEVGGQGTTKGQSSERKHYKSYSIPLLEATSKGIVEIFDVIIEKHPQAIEYISDDEENVLHVAIGHRRRDIFRRVKKMEVIMKCRLVSRIDKNGYTLLHHVADMKYYEGREQAGPAFQLQEELKWLQRVRKIIPSHYEIHRNNNNMTADELFQDTHSKQLKDAQKWIKETSQSCSAVAVLVATVVFAAAYTVPGGNDPSGRPNFIDSPFFMLFTVMDIVSLACSLTSVVMFLSILSSPFEYENFRTALPRKLVIGFTLLFVSVTTTMLSFAATIFLLLHFQKKAWTNTVIYTAAFLPVSMFALMQFPLYAAFSTCLHTLIKKIMKKAIPQKFIPHYLRTKKRKIY